MQRCFRIALRCVLPGLTITDLAAPLHPLPGSSAHFLLILHPHLCLHLHLHGPPVKAQAECLVTTVMPWIRDAW